jgi:hypothetical protein
MSRRSLELPSVVVRPARAALAVLLLLSLAAPAHASVTFQSIVGFNPGGIFQIQGSQDTPTSIDFGDFSYGGALCPAPGTPNYLCAHLRSAAGISGGGRLLLRTEARNHRTDAQPPVETYAGYATGQIVVGGLGGWAPCPPPTSPSA